jgi:hypothetical protein
MSRAYNLAVPLFVLVAFAWLASGSVLSLSWATFCASVLHMSDVAIIRIHVVMVWLFLVLSTLIFLVQIAVLMVPAWRRRIRPRAITHIAVFLSLFTIAVNAAIVSKPKFQRLYRVFQAKA